MIDVVFPNKNEAEFIEMAKKLGISALIFAYKNPSEFSKHTNALFVEPKHIQKARNLGVLSICPASREALERGADIVYGFELLEPKDHTHYRSSGMNQVLCAIAAEKKVRIGFSLAEIFSYTGQKRAMLLGRIMQNIRFCQKFKTPMKIASFATEPYGMRAPKDVAALFSQLGMSAGQIQNALK